MQHFVCSTEFEDQRWDPYDDICPVKTFQRTNRAVKKDNDKFLGYDQKTSTRFDRNFSISDFLKINLGTEVGLPLVRRFVIVGDLRYAVMFLFLGWPLGSFVYWVGAVTSSVAIRHPI